jgi:NAD(P)H-hydrate repair Nnr-like enzyme with NAD(P)H-hydrate dehydratase domain
VLAVGGSAEIPGAVVLAATAALRAGAGKLQIATVRSAATHVATAVPEAAENDAVVIGPGMSNGPSARRVARLGFLARELLAEVPLLLREQDGRRR